MDIPKGGIGFFDSGIGGLTVLSSCLSLAENRPVYYYGDNVRAPYGNLSADKIREYTAEAFDLFAKLEVCAAVIACNTATAVCAEEIRKRFSFPVIGTEPAVLPAAKSGGEIFVLATRATAESTRLINLCARARKEYPRSSVRIFACDSLAGEIEKHFFQRDCFDFSSLFPPGHPEGVVLGCTHYVFLKEQAGAFYRCPVYDGNEGISRVLENVLRDSQPLTSTGTLSVPLVTTSDVLSLPAPLFLQKKNIRSFQFCENRQKSSRKEGFFDVFFLGSGKKVNKTVCKQMFAMSFEGEIFK